MSGSLNSFLAVLAAALALAVPWFPEKQAHADEVEPAVSSKTPPSATSGGRPLGLSVGLAPAFAHLNQTGLEGGRDHLLFGLWAEYEPRELAVGQWKTEFGLRFLPVRLAGFSSAPGSALLSLGARAHRPFKSPVSGTDARFHLGWDWFNFLGGPGAIEVIHAQGPRLGAEFQWNPVPRRNRVHGLRAGAHYQLIMDGVGIGRFSRNFRLSAFGEYELRGSPERVWLIRLEIVGFAAQPRLGTPHYRGSWFMLGGGLAI